MQSHLDRVNKWTFDWGIKLSNKNGTKADNFTLKSGDKIIPRVSEFKFLGVTFDAQLTFKGHINNITKNSKITLNLLRAILATIWGAQTEAMLMVYKACILSSIDYGAQAYGCAPPHLLQ